jgi:excisionase family DNA binding protein
MSLGAANSLLAHERWGHTRGLCGDRKEQRMDVVRETVSVEEAAAILGIGRSLAYELADRGEIPHASLGKAARRAACALD